jgi:hypothetical protein
MVNVWDSVQADTSNTNSCAINVLQSAKNALKMQINAVGVSQDYCLQKGITLVLKHAPQVLS